MDIGRNIRQIRAARKLSMQQLSDRMLKLGSDISAQTIGKWERGECSISAQIIPIICDAMSCSVYTIYYLDTEQRKEQSRLLNEISQLPLQEQQILQYIMDDWHGDHHTLCHFAALYAALPENVREQVAYTGIRLYMSEAKKGTSLRSVNISAIMQGWKKISGV